MKLNARAKDIADFQRIERGFIRSSDKNLKFKTLSDGERSPIEKEMFQKRLRKAFQHAIEKREVFDNKIKEKKAKKG